MVKRLAPSKPLAVAVIGTGTTPKKMLEGLLNDFTAPYEELTFILPVSEDHWTDDLGLVHDWVVANDIPYVAVTTSAPPAKALVEVLEGADSVQKVARISTKLVQLLQSEAAEADVALLVFWDEDDDEAVLAVNKALASEVKAYNLLDGLDEFTFDDEEEGDEAPLPDDEKAAAEEEEEGDEPDNVATDVRGVGDDYDDWGVRKLRAALREHPNKALNDRAIGQLDKDDAIRALRVADQAALSGDEPDVPAEDDEETSDEAQQAPKAARTTRARRAFAEGVAEATGQDADDVELPRAKGGVLLEEQGYDDEPELAVGTATESSLADFSHGSYEDTSLRREALALAVQTGVDGQEVIPLAQRFELYLKGERKSPGRPRADGSPAQPREINPETGKPVRRRGTRSTE